MTIGIVSTFSLKGGVGKTSISLAVQLELQKKGSSVKIITNDPVSPIGAVLDENDFVQLSKKQNFPKDLQKKGDWILDMGGYLDNRILPILKQSKTIIIPTFTDYPSLIATRRSVKEIESHNNKIILIANKTAKNDFMDTYETLRDVCGNYPVFPVKTSKAFENIYVERKAISQTMIDNPLLGKAYADVSEQVRKIINHLEGTENA
jgi:MinD-like ATPase involved in chromosome partitioning or flagellar assembly